LYDGGDALWEYEPSSDTWAKVPGTPPSALRPVGGQGIAAPASDYGVVIFVVQGEGYQSVWLYKHSE